MKINTNKKFNYNLVEAYSNGLQMVVLDNKGNIRHKPVRCKDYFQDMYWSEKLKKGNVKQYGFEWDGNNNKPVSKQRYVYLGLISNDSTILIENAYNMLKMLNCVENHLKIPFTTLQRDDNEKKNIILKYSNKWSNKPYLLSLFFLLVRSGFHYEGVFQIDNIYKFLTIDILKKSLSDGDKNSLFQLSKTEGLKEILLNKQKVESDWESYNLVYDIHNDSGIVSISNKYYGKNKTAVKLESIS
jgi:hypothetical protein